MSDKLPFEPEDLGPHYIFPFREMGAYEVLWTKEGVSFRKIVRRCCGSEALQKGASTRLSA